MELDIPSPEELDGIDEMSREDKDELKRIPSVGLICDLKPILLDQPELLMVVARDDADKAQVRMILHRDTIKSFIASVDGFVKGNVASSEADSTSRGDDPS